MEKFVLSSSYSLQASKLFLPLVFATLLFLPSHVVAAIASDCVSRLDVDRLAGPSDLDRSESVDGTSSRADAAAVVPAYKRSQGLQPLLGASKHSIYFMKAGRKLLEDEIPFVQSPPGSTNPTEVPPAGVH